MRTTLVGGHIRRVTRTLAIAFLAGFSAIGRTGAEPLQPPAPTAAIPAAFTEAALLATPPPGPYCSVSVQKPAVGVKTPIAAPPPQVAALYQYHYNEATGEGFPYNNKADALSQHPAQIKNYSYKSVAWHARELSAMRDTGIDIALCNYWGNPADRASPPGQGSRWSFEGLKPLVEAAAQMNKTKRLAPKIGLYLSVGSFLNNTAHYNPDLATSDGRAWLYVSLRDFFSFIPPRLRATGPNNGPLVFVPYTSLIKNGVGDEALWQYIRAHFVADFGIEPCLILQSGWQNGGRPSVGLLGGINGTFPQVATPLEGLHETDQVASFGPGIDLRENGRKVVFRDREKGAFYEKQWRLLLSHSPANRPRLVLLETWNQWEQGTAIAPSREYGDQYVRMTRKWADLFHSGFYAKRPLVPGPYRDANRVSWFAATADKGAASGLRLVVPTDGLFEINKTAVGGAYVEASDASVGSLRYLYFDVNDSFLFDADDNRTDSPRLRLTFEYWDEGRDPILIQYDATKIGEAINNRDTPGYTVAAEFSRTDTRTWKTKSVFLDHPRFANRENGGADFRFHAPKTTPLRFRWVTLQRSDGSF